MPPSTQNVQAETRLSAKNRQVYSYRQRLLPADILATPGILLLNPVDVSGYAYRLVGANFIANGGAAAGITALVIGGYQGLALVSLVSVAVAGLTQSTLLRLGDANVTILANGASFALCDRNTGLRVFRTGAALTGATSIDVNLAYAIEKL